MNQIIDHKIMMSSKNARNASSRSKAPATIKNGVLNTDDWTVIWQPKDELKYNFQTTYDANTERSQSGNLPLGNLFTVEQLSYVAQSMPTREVSKILKFIAKGQEFWLHYFSLYHNAWRTSLFYVGKGDCNIGSLVDNQTKVKEFTFNMTSKWYLDW